MQEKPLEDLNKLLEIIFSELLAADETGKFDRQPWLRKHGEYPSGWAWELDSEGKVLWCSHEVIGILGFKPDDLIGKPLHAFAQSPQVVERIQTALGKCEPIYNLQVEFKRQDGTPLPLLINALYRSGEAASQSGYRGIAQIIKTEARTREEVATGMLQHRQAIFAKPEPAPVATWQASPGYHFQDGKLIALAPHEELQIPPQAMAQGRTLRLPILNQQGMALGAIEFHRKADDPRWSEDEKELAHAVTEQLALALQDVRSYQLAQQALQEMQEADRLKTQFLANVSHELRTPLNSIIGFSRVILKGIDGPVTDTQRQDLTAIFNAGQHLLGLINNILDFSKIESGRMELAFSQVDLSEIIRAVVATANGLIKDRPIELTLQLPDQLPLLWADSMRVRQVLLNLVSNAIKFTDRGKIDIAAQMKEEGDRKEVQISVSDTGPGISIEDQKKLFEPFSQLDASPTRKTGGSGLGLSICRHLVELHGGRIWVESTPGQGSAFRFTLPLHPIETTQQSDIKPGVLSFFTDPKKHQAINQLINAIGMRYYPISSAENIIDEIKTVQPKMILIDPSISDGLGWRSICQIGRTPGAGLIPIKAVALTDDLQESTTLGVAAFLTQPVEPDALQSIYHFLSPEPGKGNRVLVIDDALDHRKRLEDLLAAFTPASIDIATSDFEGLVAARQHVPDLILLNLFLANAAGFRVVEALRIDDRTKAIPVILLLPAQLRDVQLRQLALWTNHCLQKATTPIRASINAMLHSNSVRR